MPQIVLHIKETYAYDLGYETTAVYSNAWGEILTKQICK